MNKFLIFGVLSFFTFNSWAQTFTIRITPEAGFEAIDAIYNEFNTQQPQSILTILNDYPPESVDYLNSIRPTGDLLELMIASPDWAPAQLARMMVINYSYPTDVTAVNDNFDSNPNLEVVSYDYNLDPINFSPEEPVDTDSTTVELAFLSFMDCQVPATNLQGQTYDIEVIGNTINLLRIGSDPTPPSTFICGIQPTDLITYELGVLAQGTYTLNIYNVFRSTEFPAPTNERYLMGQTTLFVRGTEPVSVPILSFWFLSVLTLLIGLIGLTQVAITKS